MSGPILLVNPRAGEGAADEIDWSAEAAARGITAVNVEQGDLENMTREAAEGGAGALAVAGGDGSQGVVAGVAAESDIPYACVPAGTRNHLAADLGIDRGDPMKALDALRDGVERRIDLGDVNGRVFVNNATLGVYAEAVNREEFREAKLRTLIGTIIDLLRSEGPAPELRWRDPESGEERSSALLILSNNPYEPSLSVGSGSRPRLDSGTLGVLDVRAPGGSAEGPPWRQFVAAEFEVEAEEAVSVAIDGDGDRLEPPLRFRSRPGALRVRLPR